MAFPTNPVNGQQATVNGVIYTYVSATPAWSVTTNAGANVSANNISAVAAITAASVSATGNVYAGNLINAGSLTVTSLVGSGLISTTGNIVGTNITSTSAFSGPGTGLTGTAASLSIGGLAGSASYATYLNSSNYIQRTGSSGNLDTDFQNTPAGTYRYSGDDASLANSPGGTWWIYENMRHSNPSSYWGTQVAWGWEDNANRLATRNVVNGSFGGWVYYLNSSNYTSYAPSLTGSGASGTWGISVSGTATYLSSAGQQNLIVGYASTATDVNTANDTGSFSCRSNGGATTVASMSFHRPGLYAINMGLGADNVFRIGGWSASANAFQMDGSGNLTMLNNVTAYSDERLKKNWRPVQEGFVSKLAKVKSGIYDRTDVGTTQAGASAQSMQKLLPEVVIELKDGMLAINYGAAALVSSIELAKIIEKMEKRITELEKQLKDK
jgi:hypothetical protein